MMSDTIESKFFYHVPAQGRDPAELDDRQLLREIFLVARIKHFVEDWDRRVEINPLLMAQNYGIVLCDGNLSKAVAELLVRTQSPEKSSYSPECAAFLDAVKAISPRYKGGPYQDVEAVASDIIFSLPWNGRSPMTRTQLKPFYQVIDQYAGPHESVSYRPVFVNRSVAEPSVLAS